MDLTLLVVLVIMLVACRYFPLKQKITLCKRHLRVPLT
ncbi:hypothetical protein UYSO10_1967 [Kosakonia radicincitans]|nr:hypothetical protein UYSO10_1967 [Kosakonia radicincitans]